MFGFDSVTRFPRLSLALAGAAARLRGLLGREAQKARLLRLDAIGLGSDVGERALSAGEGAATWADRLFARCAGSGAGLRYDGERGHWTAVVPLFEGGPTVAFVVDECDGGRPFEALLAGLEIVAADAPPVVAAEHPPPGSVCVRFSDCAGRWQAYAPCDACGGGWLNTIFDDLDHAPLARLTARRLVVEDPGHRHGERADAMRCLHCATR